MSQYDNLSKLGHPPKIFSLFQTSSSPSSSSEYKKIQLIVKIVSPFSQELNSTQTNSKSQLHHLLYVQASQQRDLKPSLTSSLSQSLPTASSSSSSFPSSSSSTSSTSQSSSPSQLLHNLPPGISIQKGTEPQSSSPSQVTWEVDLQQ